MSALMVLKSVTLTQISDSTPKKLKESIVKLFNVIQEDLNTHSYEPSSDVDDALKEMDQALIELDQEPEEVFTTTNVKEIPPIRED